MAGRLLGYEGINDAELSILFVNDLQIKELNHKYRGETVSTDVLAFPMDDVQCPRLLGDVVISIETAKREADARGYELDRELALYLTHGILHLLGYDDIKSSDRKVMRRKERELLETTQYA
ncbi:MAG: rRNA maturation RNase YbeY [Nitrospirae bacterium]|nr:rRNA maturation RNase YbeY [Nitrospirota bacterium]